MCVHRSLWYTHVRPIPCCTHMAGLHQAFSFSPQSSEGRLITSTRRLSWPFPASVACVSMKLALVLKRKENRNNQAVFWVTLLPHLFLLRLVSQSLMPLRCRSKGAYALGRVMRFSRGGGGVSLSSQHLEDWNRRIKRSRLEAGKVAQWVKCLSHKHGIWIYILAPMSKSWHESMCFKS